MSCVQVFIRTVNRFADAKEQEQLALYNAGAPLTLGTLLLEHVFGIKWKDMQLFNVHYTVLPSSVVVFCIH